MKATELISALQKAVSECGDLEIWASDPKGKKIKIEEVVRKERNDKKVSHYQYIEIR